MLGDPLCSSQGRICPKPKETENMKSALKRLLCTALAAAAVLPASGCTERSDSGKKKVGLAMPAKSLERWNR